jgi:hypothetical protein
MILNIFFQCIRMILKNQTFMDLNGFKKNASKCKEMFILTKWVAST